MSFKPYTLERATFIGGVLLPAGSTVEADNIVTGRGAVAAGKMRASDNLVGGEALEAPEYEVADVAPRAPGTTGPQGIPSGTVQVGNALVLPGAEGETTATLVGDKHEAASKRKN